MLLCFDEHHRTRIRRLILERAVESMVSGATLVFKDQSLRARSIKLNLAKGLVDTKTSLVSGVVGAKAAALSGLLGAFSKVWVNILQLK